MLCFVVMYRRGGGGGGGGRINLRRCVVASICLKSQREELLDHASGIICMCQHPENSRVFAHCELTGNEHTIIIWTRRCNGLQVRKAHATSQLRTCVNQASAPDGCILGYSRFPKLQSLGRQGNGLEQVLTCDDPQCVPRRGVEAYYML